MWIILGLMCGGGFLGYLLRNKKYVNSLAEKLTSPVIYLLLFFMGLSIGVNKELLSGFRELGFQALSISVLSVLGSIFMARIIEKLFFKASPDKYPDSQSSEEITR